MESSNSRAVVRLAVVCVLALALAGLAGCGSSDEPKGSEPVADTSEVAAADKKESEFSVTIDGCTVGTDYEGSPAVIVDFTFTNSSEEDQSFASACMVQAFQNGVQLETAIVMEDLGNGYLAEVKPGGTVSARLAYKLADQTDVSVEVEEFMSFEDTVLAEATFSVA